MGAPSVGQRLTALSTTNLGSPHDGGAVAEGAAQLGVVPEMPVADDPQLAALPQRGTCPVEHGPGRGVGGCLVRVERRVVEHQVDTARRYVRHPVPHQEVGHGVRPQVGPERRLGRGDRQVRLVDESHRRFGVGERGGGADDPVSAAQVDDAVPAAALGQMVQEEAGADVEALGAEDPGVVDNRPAGDGADTFGQVVAVRPWAGGAGQGRVGGAEDQSGLLDREGGSGGADDPLEQFEGGGVDLLHHAGADDDGVGMHGRGEPVQLVLQERQTLRDAYEEDVDPLRWRVPGRQETYGVRVVTVAGKVRQGGALREVRVGDLYRTVPGQHGGQRTPAVAHHDHGAGQVDRLCSIDPLQLPQQIFVGSVPGAERVARVLGEAGEVEPAL